MRLMCTIVAMFGRLVARATLAISLSCHLYRGPRWIEDLHDLTCLLRMLHTDSSVVLAILEPISTRHAHSR
jgi:hypothetical protein